MNLTVALVSGFTLGCIHAFDADHIAAVSALSGRSGRLGSAIRLGLAWGLGHSAVLLLVGGLAVAFRLAIPGVVQDWAETLAGALLVVLGAWTLREVMREWRVHIHRHAHDGREHIHLHRHAPSSELVHHHEHRHHHSMFAIGAAHGLAGTGAIVLLIPVALADSPGAALLFLACFGLGTMAAMTMVSALFNAAVNAVRSVRAVSLLRGTAGAASLAIGVLWITVRLF